MPQQAPKTATELNRLVAKRDALRDQLESITSRRSELAQQRLNAEARARAGLGTQDAQMAKEMEGRINELGTKSRSIEAELDKTEDAIAQARANGVGADEDNSDVAPVVSPDVRVNPQIHIPPFMFGGNEALIRSKYETMMIAEGAILLLLAVIGWRIVWVSAKRRFARAADALFPGITELRQSVDAIAVEVERISENQRYVTRLLTEGSAAQKIESAPKESLKRL
ncbi:MAG TPA: hypothetical protein VJ867_11925 [Gemmatimonadaceae bacterium]|nr:hypothetical protein [Gemmatimonadaceae bacterium]